MTTLSVSLMWCIAQVTLFTASAALLYFVARKVHAAIGAAVAIASLTLVLGITLLAASPWPRWEFARSGNNATLISEQTATHATSTGTIGAISDSPVPRVNDTSLASPSTFAVAWEAFTREILSPRPIADVQQTRSAWHWTTILLLLVTLGLAISLARLLWGLRGVTRLVRGSRAIEDQALVAELAQLQSSLKYKGGVLLRESTDIVSPATVGWRRPTILLPPAWREWSQGELRAVLAHELAHVTGRDYASWIVARLAVAVHFYHPLVRWLAGRLQLEQELAADATAARLVGDRQQYLHTLARLALAMPPQSIAGPARTLFPSRSLLMRRVEMLREMRNVSVSTTSTRALRFATLGLLAGVALAVAGVRQAATAQPAATKPAENVASSGSEAAERISLSVVPADAVYMAAMRPAEVFANEGLKDVAETFNENIAPLKESGVKVSEIREVVVVVYGDLEGGGRIRFAIRFTSAELCMKFINHVTSTPEMKQLPSGRFKAWRDESDQVTQLDEVTLVIDHSESGKTNFQQLPSFDNELPAWASEWDKFNDRQLLGAIDLESLRKLLPLELRQQMFAGTPLQMVAPMMDHIDWAVAGIQTSDALKLDALVQCDTPKNAEGRGNMVRGLLTILSNQAEQQREPILQRVKEAPPEMALQVPMVEKLFDLAAEFTSESKVTATDKQVSLAFTSKIENADVVALATGVLLPAVQSARAAAQRNVSMNNLKQLALTMHIYHDLYKHFPPAAGFEYTDPKTKERRTSKHPHSWRVAVLPYVEQQELYNEYQFDEPWDSEANKKVLAKMPDVYRSPSDDANSTNTSYFALTGPDTIFADDKGIGIRNITDGTSMTIMIVEAKRPIPWTKPEDIPYAADQPYPELGGWMPDNFLAAFGDGHVEAVFEETDEATLRAMTTKAGREVINR